MSEKYAFWQNCLELEYLAHAYGNQLDTRLTCHEFPFGDQRLDHPELVPVSYKSFAFTLFEYIIQHLHLAVDAPKTASSVQEPDVHLFIANQPDLYRNSITWRVLFMNDGSWTTVEPVGGSMAVAVNHLLEMHPDLLILQNIDQVHWNVLSPVPVEASENEENITVVPVLPVLPVLPVVPVVPVVPPGQKFIHPEF